MSVIKTNGFKAPYRSSTLQAQAAAQINRNGLLALSAPVTTASTNAVVPPFAFVQAGLLIQVTDQRTIAIPSGIVAPYYLAVHATTATAVDDLVWSFIKSPRDVTTQAVVAYYDGEEWHSATMVSVDGLLLDKQADRVDTGDVGARTGMLTSVVSSNYSNAAGALVDKQGLKVKYGGAFVTPIIVTDPDWSRIDRMIYRRPADSTNRPGVRKLVVGGTFSDSQTAHQTTLLTSTTLDQRNAVLVDSANNVHFFYAKGSGGSFTIRYQKYDSARTSQLVADTSITAATDGNFSVAIDSADHLHLVFLSGNHVKYMKLSNVGATLVASLTADAQAVPCSTPKVVVDPLQTKVFIAFAALTASPFNKIFLTTRHLDGTLLTADVQVASTANNLINPSIAVTDDLLVYLAYEDSTATKVFYLVTDDFGAVVTAAVELSAATDYGGSPVADLASLPQMFVADNKVPFVLFLQDKQNGGVGVAVYTAGAATMIDLVASLEVVTSYAAAIDPINNGVHLTIVQSTRVDYFLLNAGAIANAIAISGAGGAYASLVRDNRGSLVQVWSASAATTVKFVKTVAAPSEAYGLSVAELTTDVLLTRIQMPGSKIVNFLPPGILGANAERFNAYGDTLVDWGATTAGDLTLSVNSLQVIDLLSGLVYTVVSGSYAMAEGQALYVPLDGVTTSVTPVAVDIDKLPYHLSIKTLGFIKGGRFYPQLLGMMGVPELGTGGVAQGLNEPLRISATYPTPDSKLRIAASQLTLADGRGVAIPPDGSAISPSPTSWVDFQAGTTSGATFSITFPSGTVGKYRRCVFTRMPDGSITATFSAEVVAVGSLADPATLIANGGRAIGWVDLQCTGTTTYKTAGSTTSVIENSTSISSTVAARIVQFPIGSSGSDDNLKTLLAAAKGTASYSDTDWGTIRQLREHQNILYSGGGTFAWAPNSLSWSAAISVSVAGRASAYTISAGSASLTADGQVGYIKITDDTGGDTLAVTVAAITAVPTNPVSGGFDKGIQVLFARVSGAIVGFGPFPDLSSGYKGRLFGKTGGKPLLQITAVGTGGAATPYTVLDSDQILEITTGSTDRVLNFPALSSLIPGSWYIAKKIDAGSGKATLTPFSGDAFEGGPDIPNFVLHAAGDSIYFYASAAAWRIIA